MVQHAHAHKTHRPRDKETGFAGRFSSVSGLSASSRTCTHPENDFYYVPRTQALIALIPNETAATPAKLSLLQPNQSNMTSTPSQSARTAAGNSTVMTTPQRLSTIKLGNSVEISPEDAKKPHSPPFARPVALGGSQTLSPRGSQVQHSPPKTPVSPQRVTQPLGASIMSPSRANIQISPQKAQMSPHKPQITNQQKVVHPVQPTPPTRPVPPQKPSPPRSPSPPQKPSPSRANPLPGILKVSGSSPQAPSSSEKLSPGPGGSQPHAKENSPPNHASLSPRGAGPALPQSEGRTPGNQAASSAPAPTGEEPPNELARFIRMLQDARQTLEVRRTTGGTPSTPQPTEVARSDRRNSGGKNNENAHGSDEKAALSSSAASDSANKSASARVRLSFSDSTKDNERKPTSEEYVWDRTTAPNEHPSTVSRSLPFSACLDHSLGSVCGDGRPVYQSIPCESI